MDYRALIVIVLLIVACASRPGFTQQSAPAAPTPRAESASGEDVYNSEEVDTRAKIRDRGRLLPDGPSSCPPGSKLGLRVTFHKSGEVTDVAVTWAMDCDFQQKVIEHVRGVRFTPATKGGAAVSQYQDMLFIFNCL